MILKHPEKLDSPNTYFINPDNLFQRSQRTKSEPETDTNFVAHETTVY